MNSKNDSNVGMVLVLGLGAMAMASKQGAKLWNVAAQWIENLLCIAGLLVIVWSLIYVIYLVITGYGRDDLVPPLNQKKSDFRSAQNEKEVSEDQEMKITNLRMEYESIEVPTQEDEAEFEEKMIELLTDSKD